MHTRLAGVWEHGWVEGTHQLGKACSLVRLVCSTHPFFLFSCVVISGCGTYNRRLSHTQRNTPFL